MHPGPGDLPLFIFLLFLFLSRIDLDWKEWSSPIRRISEMSLLCGACLANCLSNFSTKL